jgi:uncharacterized membrane protein HdeD (DUF308 family)
MDESAAPSPGRIFISYRREETAYPAGWLYDRLAVRYGGQVFKDVDSIELGDDFVEMITAAVGSCDVLLALVGDQWLTITDEDGRRRLDDPDDFVRLEIEAALARNVRVIPILVGGARLPRAEERPPSLARLVRRQALELSPARFDFDTSRLLKVLDKTLAEVRTAHEDSASAPARKAPDPSATEPPTAPERQEQTRQSRTFDVDLFPPETTPPSKGEPTDSGIPASTPTRTPQREGPPVPQASALDATPTDSPPSTGRHVNSGTAPLAAIIAGIAIVALTILPVAFGAPEEAINAMLGLLLIVYGVFRIVQSFATGEAQGARRQALVVLGVLSLFAGGLAVPYALADNTYPIVVIIVLFWLIGGPLEAVAAIKGGGSRPTRRLEIVSGVFGASVGIVLLILASSEAWTAFNNVTFISLIILGIMVIIVGFKQREAVRRLAAPGATQAAQARTAENPGR